MCVCFTFFLEPEWRKCFRSQESHIFIWMDTRKRQINHSILWVWVWVKECMFFCSGPEKFALVFFLPQISKSGLILNISYINFVLNEIYMSFKRNVPSNMISYGSTQSLAMCWFFLFLFLLAVLLRFIQFFRPMKCYGHKQSCLEENNTYIRWHTSAYLFICTFMCSFLACLHALEMSTVVIHLRIEIRPFRDSFTFKWHALTLPQFLHRAMHFSAIIFTRKHSFHLSLTLCWPFFSLNACDFVCLFAILIPSSHKLTQIFDGAAVWISAAVYAQCAKGNAFFVDVVVVVVCSFLLLLYNQSLFATIQFYCVAQLNISLKIKTHWYRLFTSFTCDDATATQPKINKATKQTISKHRTKETVRPGIYEFNGVRLDWIFQFDFVCAESVRV